MSHHILSSIRRMVERSKTDKSRVQTRERGWCGVEKQFNEEELLAIEKKRSIKLPGFYREFLRELGSGVYFSTLGDCQVGLELRRIDDMLDIVASWSRQKQHDVFSKYIPIGRDRETGQLLLLKMDSEHDAEIVLVPEMPKCWDELDVGELTSYAFDAWLASRIDTTHN